MWRAGILKVTDEIRRDGKRVWYPVSKIRRGLETSRTGSGRIRRAREHTRRVNFLGTIFGLSLNRR